MGLIHGHCVDVIPSWMLLLHTCVDVISFLDVDEHIPVVTSYPPWMLTSTLPQMNICPGRQGDTGIIIRFDRSHGEAINLAWVYENCSSLKYVKTLQNWSNKNVLFLHTFMYDFFLLTSFDSIRCRQEQNKFSKIKVTSSDPLWCLPNWANLAFACKTENSKILI